eukprot:TRINITY_DN15059_c0_g1_i1.p1 TRINITY_DN15059_c0_g1~~TRINITY_DN15059_c0_g1_i1.p1  ORF type:complete len:126 (-),score=26.32 TRINITY_DN15059_c0_g1_i1:818-1195(-)
MTSGVVQKSLQAWGIHHRLSSAYNPHSNYRAELAMKAGKKLLRNNAGLGGSLETDRVMRAVMQFRNTLMQDCRRSPAPLTMKVVVKTMSRTRLGVTNTIEKHFTRVERGEGRHRDPSDELSASIQ